MDFECNARGFSQLIKCNNFDVGAGLVCTVWTQIFVTKGKQAVNVLVNSSALKMWTMRCDLLFRPLSNGGSFDTLSHFVFSSGQRVMAATLMSPHTTTQVLWTLLGLSRQMTTWKLRPTFMKTAVCASYRPTTPIRKKRMVSVGTVQGCLSYVVI